MPTKQPKGKDFKESGMRGSNLGRQCFMRREISWKRRYLLENQWWGKKKLQKVEIKSSPETEYHKISRTLTPKEKTKSSFTNKASLDETKIICDFSNIEISNKNQLQ